MRAEHDKDVAEEAERQRQAQLEMDRNDPRNPTIVPVPAREPLQPLVFPLLPPHSEFFFCYNNPACAF